MADSYFQYLDKQLDETNKKYRFVMIGECLIKTTLSKEEISDKFFEFKNMPHRNLILLHEYLEDLVNWMTDKGFAEKLEFESIYSQTRTMKGNY